MDPGEECDGSTGGETCASLGHYNVLGALTNGTCTNTLMFGTASGDLVGDVAVDGSGNIVIVGTTAASLDGQPHAGGNDLYIVKYAPSGVRQWTRMLGTTGSDAANGVAIDGSGNIYVAGTTNVAVDGSGNAHVVGYTSGALSGHVNLGTQDIVWLKVNTSGVTLSFTQWGSTGSDTEPRVAVDGAGHAWVAGRAQASIDGLPHAGASDVFLTYIP